MPTASSGARSMPTARCWLEAEPVDSAPATFAATRRVSPTVDAILSGMAKDREVSSTRKEVQLAALLVVHHLAKLRRTNSDISIGPVEERFSSSDCRNTGLRSRRGDGLGNARLAKSGPGCLAGTPK